MLAGFHWEKTQNRSDMCLGFVLDESCRFSDKAITAIYVVCKTSHMSETNRMKYSAISTRLCKEFVRKREILAHFFPKVTSGYRSERIENITKYFCDSKLK